MPLRTHVVVPIVTVKSVKKFQRTYPPPTLPPSSLPNWMARDLAGSGAADAQYTAGIAYLLPRAIPVTAPPGSSMCRDLSTVSSSLNWS